MALGTWASDAVQQHQNDPELSHHPDEAVSSLPVANFIFAQDSRQIQDFEW
ncbi:hypothetical protein EMPG_16943 [Blastomyces silverae]|uniref:Uncharacterized protein n=1 Tax=Blastomyces silverae TaxID=2060906 RepID=A0A0H1B868_9EURO|nr:hypothetical protein EMPG_16943 [Blastomyces silverae]